MTVTLESPLQLLIKIGTVRTDGRKSIPEIATDLACQSATSFECEYITPLDGNFGSFNGTWNGMIGETVINRTDMTIPYMTPTNQRIKDVPYIPGLFCYRYSISMFMNPSLQVAQTTYDWPKTFGPITWMFLILFVMFVNIKPPSGDQKLMASVKSRNWNSAEYMSGKIIHKILLANKSLSNRPKETLLQKLNGILSLLSNYPMAGLAFLAVLFSNFALQQNLVGWHLPFDDIDGIIDSVMERKLYFVFAKPFLASAEPQFIERLIDDGSQSKHTKDVRTLDHLLEHGKLVSTERAVVASIWKHKSLLSFHESAYLYYSLTIPSAYGLLIVNDPRFNLPYVSFVSPTFRRPGRKAMTSKFREMCRAGLIGYHHRRLYPVWRYNVYKKSLHIPTGPLTMSDFTLVAQLYSGMCAALLIILLSEVAWYNEICINMSLTLG